MSLELRPSLSALATELTAPLTLTPPDAPSEAPSDTRPKGPSRHLLGGGKARGSEAGAGHSAVQGGRAGEGRGARQTGSSSSSSRASGVGKQGASKPVSAKTSACSADVVCVSDRWLKELVGRRALAPLDGVEAAEWFQRLGPTWRVSRVALLMAGTHVEGE